MTAKRRLLNCDEVMETSLDQNEGSVGGKMLPKNEKAAEGSNGKVNKTEISVKPMRRR